MANEYFVHGSYPSTGAAGASAGMRSELDAITAGFNKLPNLAANGGFGVFVNASGNAMEAVQSTGTGNAVRATNPTFVAADKATPIDADTIALGDSAAVGVLKWLTFANLRAALKDVSGGVAGLTGFALNIWNAAKTFKSLLSFSGTANRSHVLPDKDGTVAMLSDFAAPGPIGGTTPAAVAATTLSASGSTTLGKVTHTANSDIYESASNAAAAININYVGYAGGTTQPRVLNIYDGQTHQIAAFNTTGLAVTGALNASDSLIVNGTGAKKLEVISGISGNAFLKMTTAGQQDWTIGIDRADGGKLKFAPTGDIATGTVVTLDASGNLSNTGSHTIGSFTLATRPAQAAGKMIYVSDGGAGAVFQGSNGGAWVNLG